MSNVFARLCVLLVWAIAPPASGQSAVEHSRTPGPPPGMLLSSAESERLVEEGRRALIDFRFREAEANFTRLANRPDGRAAGMYHLSVISFVRYVMSDRESDMVDFVLRSDELRHTLQEQPDTPWRHLLGAETNLQRAVVWAKQGRYVRAALAGRTAYRTYSDLVTHHPEVTESLKGYGLLKVAIDTLPTTYRRFLSLAGFSGNTTEGYRALRTAASSGGYMQVEASIYLALLDTVLDGSRGDGGDRLEKLHRDYPESPLFAHLYGYYLFENRRSSEAEAVFRKAAEKWTDKDVFYIDYVDHFLGMTLFRQNRFVEAISFFERYQAVHEGDALMAPTVLHHGLALEMLGRRDEAMTLYRTVNATRELEADVVSSRRAQHLLARPMTSVEQTLQRGANAYDAGNYVEAKSLLSHVLADADATVELQAEASYRLGRTYQAVGELDTALGSYAEAIGLKGTEEARWAPWSAYHIGEIYEQRNELSDAVEAYEEALSYPGTYDYHQALKNNARLALQRIREAS